MSEGCLLIEPALLPDEVARIAAIWEKYIAEQKWCCVLGDPTELVLTKSDPHEVRQDE
jgi:hypothetical protein